MAEEKRQDIELAFKTGDKIVAEKLLPRVLQPSDITTAFDFDIADVLGPVSVSLLHLAAFWGWMDTVTTLVGKYGMATNREDSNGHIPLHYAACNGHLELVKYFCLDRDLVDKKDANGRTPIFYACRNGHFHIVQYLIEEAQCNPLYADCIDWTLVHYASLNGHFNIVQLIIKVYKMQNRDPFCKNWFGSTPLHLACGQGHLKIVQYLIREEHCNPSCEDITGHTPLHCACQRNGQPHIVQYLLSTGRVNPLTKDKDNHTALYYASDKYDIIKLFQPFEECREAFPVRTFTKLILTGDSGAGKTTITKLILHLASHRDTTVEYISNADRFTAGIIPHHIQNMQMGKFVVYDFAGQQEYHSSHSAVLEQVMRKSTAIFICMLDLSERKEKVCESLHYWLSYIDNACSTAEGRSHVLIIGSHVDTASSLKEKTSQLETIATKRIKRQEYKGFIAMDCRRAYSDASRRLIATLTNSERAITASQPTIHYFSHVVYAFLLTKLGVVGCTLNDLVSAIAQENDFSLPSNQSVLIEILTTLSDKGLILFVHHPYSSWIIVKTEALLNEMNGTLFAPGHFKEHRDLASNTGIVPVSNLQKVFPNYNSDMLVGFLMSLQFCQPVDSSLLQYANLQTTPSHSTADLLFFPGLVQSERPDSLIQQLGALEFGWCLKCIDPKELLSSRFFHLLLLSIADKYPLASRFNPRSSISGLQCKCTIWKNGIFWRDENTCTVIELLDINRCVLVAMSCDDTSPVEHAELRSSLIGLVRHLQQQYCPRLNVRESLISPDLIQRYPLDNLPDSDLFDIHHVAQSMLLRKAMILSCDDGRGYPIVKALPFEPYYQLRPSFVFQLLNPNMADQPVPAPLLQEVRQLCHQTQMEPQTYYELREHLDTLSLFAGRSPLVSGMTTVVCAW